MDAKSAISVGYDVLTDPLGADDVPSESMFAAAVRAYLDALWKPIETAPVTNEDESFLVTNGDRIWIADYWYEDGKGEWVFGTGGNPTSKASEWRPLPALPA